MARFRRRRGFVGRPRRKRRVSFKKRLKRYRVARGGIRM